MNETNTPAIEPTTNPSHVLPGESDGASLCRPNRRPAKNANVSAAHTVSSTVNASRRAFSDSSRSRTRAPSPEPIHTAPRMVAPIATVDDAYHDAGDQRTHRPPNLRRRLAYSSIAARNSFGPKSGHRVSTKTNSAYADCHSKKFERRSSPDVRITRSGSGISGA